MEEVLNFTKQLSEALLEKQNWFNNERLPQLLEQYRLLHTCAQNLDEVLVKRSLIQPDPYKLDTRISDIGTVETSSFTESEDAIVLGKRLSDYERMLDFISTYFRFSVENITINKIKTLMELNSTFDWSAISTNSTKSNTRAMAVVLNKARQNAPVVTISLINDSQEKCASCTKTINMILSELGEFQKELYKGNVRKDLFEHPNFDIKKTFESPESELAEIKKLFGKNVSKKAFYSDLIQEIINEDLGNDAQAARQKVLDKLQIKVKEKKVENKTVNPRDMLNSAVMSLCGIEPVVKQICVKLDENFKLLFTTKKTFFTKIIEVFKKAFGIKEKERVCEVPVVDQRTGTKTRERIEVNEFLIQLRKIVRVYSGIAAKSAEYDKVMAASDDDVLIFLNKQISENQRLFTVINALDDYFKTNVDVSLRTKVKGMKIDLASYRNAIITVNKKRGEYVSTKEEVEQMKKLGIVKA